MASYVPCWGSAMATGTGAVELTEFSYKSCVYDDGKAFWEVNPLVRCVFPGSKTKCGKLWIQISWRVALLCRLAGFSWDAEYQPGREQRTYLGARVGKYPRDQNTISSEGLVLCISDNASRSGKAAIRRRHLGILTALFNKLVDTISYTKEHQITRMLKTNVCFGRGLVLSTGVFW